MPIHPPSIKNLTSWVPVASELLNEAFSTGSITSLHAPEPADFESSACSLFPSWSLGTRPPLDKKAFALFHGDSFISQTSLNGGNPIKNLTLLKDFLIGYKGLPDAKKNPVLQKIIQALDLPRDASQGQAFGKAVQNLGIGEEFFYPLGWIDESGGHALGVSFFKQPDGRYNLSIYNSGGGVDFHTWFSLEGKHKTGTHLKIRDIDPYLLGFANPSQESSYVFFEKLIELNRNPQSAAKYVSATTFYKDLFGPLFASCEAETLFDQGILSLQYSGTCSVKGILAWLRSQLGPTDYKRFILDFKFETLVDFFHVHQHALEKDSIEMEELRLLIQHGLQMLSRRSTEVQGTLYTHEEEKARFATLHDIATRLKLIENNIQTLRQSGQQIVSQVPCPQPISPNLDFLKNLVQPLKLTNPYFPTFNLPETFSFSPVSFAETLFGYLKLYEPVKSGIDPITHSVFLSLLIRQLPACDASFWNEIPSDKLEASLKALHSLNDVYFVKTYLPKATLPEQHADAIKTTACIHRLACRYDLEICKVPTGLKNFRLSLSCSRTMLENPYCLMFSPETFEQTIRSLDYLEAQGKSPSVLADSPHPYIITPQSCTSIPEYVLFQSALEQDASLSDAFSKFVESNEPEKSGTLPFRQAICILKLPNLFAQSSSLHLHALLHSLWKIKFFSGTLTAYKPEEIQETDYKFYFRRENGQARRDLFMGLHPFSTIDRPHPFKSGIRNPNGPYLDGTIGGRFFFRRTNQLPEENNTLLNFQTERNTPFWNRLKALSTSSYDIRPYELIALLENHFMELCDPDAQTLFEMLLFAPIQDAKGWKMPFWQELSRNPHLVEELERVISLGLTEVYERQPGNKPLLAPGLFLLRLAMRVQKRGFPLDIPCTQILSNWIKQKGWTDKEICLLHLHHVYSYAAQQLNAPFSSAELLNILESWTLFHFDSLDPTWDEPSLRCESRQFLFSLKPLFEKTMQDPIQKRFLLEGLLKRLDLEDLSNEAKDQWDISQFPLCTFKGSGESWKIHLLTGTIASNAGVISFGTPPELHKFFEYFTVFGDKRFPMKRNGDLWRFVSDLGPIRMRVISSRGSYAELIIERQLESGEWARFVPFKHLSSSLSKFPFSLLTDRTHWVSLNDPSQLISISRRPASIEIPPAVMNSHQAVMNHPTEAVEVFSWASSPFQDFESEQQAIHLERSPKGELRAVLWRYSSNGSTPLTFDYDSVIHSWRWNENPSYQLASYQPKHFFGYMRNYLLLSQKVDSETQTEILLVPRMQSEPIKLGVVSSAYALESVDPDPLYRDQACRFGFSQFTVSSSSPTPIVHPQTDEDSIHLIYLLQSQRNYSAALDVLKTLPNSILFTPTALDMLQWIFSEGRSNQDYTPSNSAFKLQVFLRLYELRYNPGAPHFEKDKKLIDSLCDHFFSYKKKRSTVPEYLRFSTAEEKLLVTLLFPDLSPKGKNDLVSSGSLVNFNSCDPRRRLSITPWGSLTINTPPEILHPFHSHFLSSELATLNLNNQLPADGIGSLTSSFGYLYEKARSCQTLEEAYAVCMQADYVTLSFSGIGPVQQYLFTALQGLIQLALLHPQKAPPLPQPGSDKLDWIKQAFVCYANCQKSPGKFFSNPRVRGIPSGKIPLSLPSENLDRLIEAATPASPPSSLSLHSPHPQALAYADFSGWVSEFFDSKPAKTSQPCPVIEVEKSDLADHEQRYASAISSGLQQFEQQWKIGDSELQKLLSFSFKDRGSVQTLKDRLITGQGAWSGTEALHKELSILEQTILGLAHKRPSEDSVALRHAGLVQAKLLSLPTLPQLVQRWGEHSASAYQNLNPLLENADIEQLDQLIGLYIQRKILFDQARSIVYKIKQWEEKASDPAAIEQSIASLLRERSHFSSSLPRMAALVEYFGELRLRPKQVEILNKLLAKDPSQQLFVNGLLQLLMGEGKTSVIAPILSAVAAQQGKIAIFTPPLPQFQTLSRAYSKTMRSTFGIEVIPLSLTREELTLERLKWVFELLQTAKNGKSVLLVSPFTFPTLLLEYKSLLREYLRIVSDREEILSKLQLLHQILMLAQTDTLNLIDESQTVLDLRKELNFPFDSPSKLNPYLIDWIRYFFEGFLDPSLKTSTGKSIAALLDIRNEDRKFDLALFNEEIAPALARYAFLKSELPSGFDRTFERFVLGKMDGSTLTAEDQNFLNEIQQLANSTQPDQMLRADRIYLSKYLISELLPACLSLKIGYRFGRLGTKVIPFDGPDNPTSNEFGNPYEAAVLSFICGVCSGKKEDRGISTQQLRTWIINLQKSASFYAQKENTTYDKTQEAIECQTLTGVPLARALEPENLARALHRVRLDPKAFLEIESESIQNSVQFFPSYDSLNPLGFGQLFGKLMGMSGTPTNWRTYHPKFKEQLFLNEGVNGQIAQVLYQQWSKDPNWKTALASPSIDHFFNSELVGKPGCTSLIDAAAFFKNESNEEVARKLKEYLKKVRPDIKAVLYYGRRTPDERPDTLMAIQEGKEESPVLIGSTTPESLQARGLSKEAIFVFYDSPHCEGSDLTQPPEASALVTVDETIGQSHFFQSATRMRGLISLKQSIRIVTTELAQKQMIRQAKTPKDFFAQLIKNDSIHTSHQLYDSTTKLLEQIAFDAGMKKILHAPEVERPNLYTQFIPLLSNQMDLSPSKTMGGISKEESPRDLLIRLKDSLLQKCKALPFRPEEITAIERESEVCIQDALKTLYLPSQIASQSSLGIGQEVQLMRQVQQQQQRQKEARVELERDLETELNQYLTLAKPVPYKEVGWEASWIEQKQFPLVQEVGVNFLCKQMELFPKYKHPYPTLFSSSLLLASKNWVLTQDQYLPVFHPAQKRAEQILVITTDNQLKFLLLSIKEAEFFKSYLNQNPRPDLWLMLASGDEISCHSHTILSSEQQKLFDQALLEVHLLNGNIRALDAISQRVEAFSQSQKNPSLVTRFLKLKVEQDEEQRTLFYQSPLCGKDPESNENLFLCTYRRNYQQTLSKNLALLSPEEIAKIPPGQVHLLPPEQVRFLTTPEQIARLPSKQINSLVPSQLEFLPEKNAKYIVDPALLNLLPPRFYPHLQFRQIQQLDQAAIRKLPDTLIPRLSARQVPMIDEKKLHVLASTQVPFASDKQISHLPDSSLVHLTAKQAAYVPPPKVPLLPKELAAHFTEQQVPYATPEQIPFLAKEKAAFLNEQQVAHATPAQIPFLSTQVTSRFSKDQIPHASAIQIPHLSEAQLVDLTNAQLAHLSASQVPFIQKERAAHFTQKQVLHATAEQIPFIPKELAVYFSHQQMKNATPEQLPYVHTDRVRSIQKELAVHFTERLIPHATNEQLPFVPKEKAAFFTQKQVPFATAQHIPFIPIQLVPFLTKDQVPFVAPHQIPHLSDERLLDLKTEQIAHVSPAQVSLLPKEWTCHFTHKQAPYASPEQVPLLPKEKAAYFTEQQVPHTTPEQIPFLANDMIASLTHDQIRFVTADQVPHLTPAQVPFVSSSQIPLLPEQLAAHLQPSQVPHLAPVQIPSLPPSLKAHLSPQQLALQTPTKQFPLPPEYPVTKNPIQAPVTAQPAKKSDETPPLPWRGRRIVPPAAPTQKPSTPKAPEEVTPTTPPEAPAPFRITADKITEVSIPPSQTNRAEPLDPSTVNSTAPSLEKFVNGKLSQRELLQKLPKEKVHLLRRTHLKVLYPGLIERISLIVKGALYSLALASLILSGVALAALVSVRMRRILQKTRTESWDLWDGIRSLSPL